MSILIRKALFCTGLSLLGVIGLQAQGYPYPPYGSNPYDRGPVYRHPYGDRVGLDLYSRVQADLDRAAYDVYGSQRHINHARKEVGDVERELSRGRFDRDEMGEAISALQHVLDHDRLPEGDRALLWRDLEKMRRLREGGYGYSGRW